MNDEPEQPSNSFLETQKKAERVLRLVEKTGLSTSQGAGFHRVGPLRVVFRHAFHTDILFGRLLLESVWEPDPEKTSAIISCRSDAILTNPFDSYDFFKRVLDAYQEAAGWFVSEDEGSKSLRIDLLFGPFSRRYTKCPKYSFPDFMVDFARYVREPGNDLDAFLSIKDVPLPSADDAYLIPDLKMPTYDERPVLTVSITADGPI